MVIYVHLFAKRAVQLVWLILVIAQLQMIFLTFTLVMGEWFSEMWNNFLVSLFFMLVLSTGVTVFAVAKLSAPFATNIKHWLIPLGLAPFFWGSLVLFLKYAD